MGDLDDYDPPERSAPEPSERCRHGLDPHECEDLECLIEWHHENPEE